MKVFRQRIDGEGLPIDALLGVNGLSEIVEHPIDAAIFQIPEVTREILVRAARGGKILRCAIDSVSLGKGPENARVQDKSFGGARINGKIVGYLPAKASVLFVDGVLKPEGQDRTNFRLYLPPQF